MVICQAFGFRSFPHTGRVEDKETKNFLVCNKAPTSWETKNANPHTQNENLTAVRLNKTNPSIVSAGARGTVDAAAFNLKLTAEYVVLLNECQCRFSDELTLIIWGTASRAIL